MGLDRRILYDGADFPLQDIPQIGIREPKIANTVWLLNHQVLDYVAALNSSQVLRYSENSNACNISLKLKV